MRNGLLVLLVVLVAIATLVIANRKHTGVFEDVGEVIDNAVEDVGDKIEDVTDKR